MTKRWPILLVLMMLISGAHTWAEGGKAVTAFNPDTGFKLSQKALETLEIKFEPISNQPPWRVSKHSLVRLKHITGVYRRIEGWIDFILVTVVRSDGEWVWITSPDLEPGDEVAVSNADFLRMTEADLKSESTDACAH